jgi:hypothetical protein
MEFISKDNPFYFITSEAVLMQKVGYINWNPIAEGLVENPEEYLYSSARFWKGCPHQGEPLEVDLKKIKWRRAEA